MGGDFSNERAGAEHDRPFAPRGRGFLEVEQLQEERNKVCPSWEGISRDETIKQLQEIGLPLVGGDFSFFIIVFTVYIMFAPRGRGFLEAFPYITSCRCVCPSWEGISRVIPPLPNASFGLPLVGGDFSLSCCVSLISV